MACRQAEAERQFFAFYTWLRSSFYEVTNVVPGASKTSARCNDLPTLGRVGYSMPRGGSPLKSFQNPNCFLRAFTVRHPTLHVSQNGGGECFQEELKATITRGNPGAGDAGGPAVTDGRRVSRTDFLRRRLGGWPRWSRSRRRARVVDVAARFVEIHIAVS